MSTLSTTNLKNPSSGSNNIVLDSSGRVLVGTSSAFAVQSGFSEVKQQIVGNDAAAFLRYSADSTGETLWFCKSRNATAGQHTVLQNGDSVTRLFFQGSDGTNFVPAASINVEVDGTPGTNDMPGRLVFSTTADGAASPTERMRIGAGGNVGIGVADTAGIRFQVTSTGTDYAGYFSYPGSTAQGIGIKSIGAGTSYAVYFFNNGANVGGIYTTAASTVYLTASDYRLKENVVPLTGAIDRVNDLQVHRFNFIAEPDKTVDGFLAHEAQAVVPECVTGEKDAVDEDGNPVYQGIDQSKLVPLLTAALQEAIARIETLETEVAALKGA